MMMYVYRHTETDPNGFWLWTVGFYNPDGTWEAESDHRDKDEAADRCAYLNGQAAQREEG